MLGTTYKVEFPVLLAFHSLNGSIHLTMKMGFIHENPEREEG